MIFGKWLILASYRFGRTAIGLGVLQFLLALWAGPVGAAELVMFESAACEWCEAWHRQIGPVYPKTEEARLAPLRRVDIHGEMPADLRHLRAVQYTPTFVLIEDGREVGRILGYPGEDFFWPLLADELAKLRPETIEKARAVAGACSAAGPAGGAEAAAGDDRHAC